MSRCYSDDSLRRLGDDDLDPEDFAVMERYVQDCLDCGSRLEALARDCPGLTQGSRPTASSGPPIAAELDDFVIEGEIGRGAMGVVHRARDRRLNRTVALKVLSQSGADADARRRWLREARAASCIRHPNVVSLYDCREVDGRLVLVLEFVAGGSLEKRIKGPLPPRAAAGMMEKIARAVGYVHSQGVVHLDLKPSNILLDGAIGETWEQTIPLISDFGLALFHEDEGDGAEPTQDGPRGTPSYMAPEQTTERRSKLGPEADVYALGVVLYELLTGRPPFRAASHHETMELARSQEPVPIRRLNPRAPRDLETIAHKCLEKAPAARYRSAEAVADDLQSWLEDCPIKARPPSLAGRGWRACRRHRAASLLGLALLATVAVSFGLLLDAYARADSARHAAESARDTVRSALQTAEAARKDAERNFETTTTVAERLEDIIIDALHYSRPMDVEHLESAAKLLRDHVWRGGVVQGYKDDGVLWRLSDIDHMLAYSHINNARFGDALLAGLEELDLIRACYEMDPTNVEYRRKQVQALEVVSQAELMLGRFGESLDHLDAASDVILSTAPTVPRQLTLAYEVSKLYLGGRDRLVRLGRVEEARLAFEGRLKLMALLEIEEPGRPARPLYLAAALADRGEMERAREVLDRVMAGARLPATASAELIQETTWAALECFSKVLTPWGRGVPTVEAVHDFCSRAVEKFHAPGIEGISTAMYYGVATEMATQRREGRIEEAERTATDFLDFATRFAARYSDAPAAYIALSEAFVQQSKNAWNRDDHHEIRQATLRAVEALRKAERLAPDDVAIRARADLYQRKLDALPPDW